MLPLMKYLGIDLGEKRIGLALSDEKGIIAAPYSTIQRDGDASVQEEIAALCKEKNVGAIVIGVPYSASETTQERFRTFGGQLAEKTGLAVREWDETFSTKQAQNMVAFSEPRPGKKDPDNPNGQVAAAVILAKAPDN